MENSILADTSILIALQKEEEAVVQKLREIDQDIVISRITATELLYGSRDKKEKNINKKFINQLEVIEINQEISLESYQLIDTYGLKIKFGIADSLIAATAIVKKVPFWTLNIKHFNNIKKLELVS